MVILHFGMKDIDEASYIFGVEIIRIAPKSSQVCLKRVIFIKILEQFRGYISKRVDNLLKS